MLMVAPKAEAAAQRERQTAEMLEEACTGGTSSTMSPMAENARARRGLNTTRHAALQHPELN